MFTICTYAEHQRHLLGQEVRNTHDGLSVRKPFLYTDSISDVEMSVAWNLARRKSELHLDLCGQLLRGSMIFPCLQMDLLWPSDV